MPGSNPGLGPGGAVTLTPAALTAIQAKILSDATPFPGARVDAAVTSRAAPGAQMALTAAEETAIQAKILSDATPFPGARVDATISSRAAPGAQMALTAAEETAIQAKILSDATPFAGATVGKSRGFFMDFWSDPIAKITVPAVAADLTFPDVVVAALPADLNIIRVIPMLKIRAIKDTSGADNKINAASKTLRIKVSTGAWGTDDIIAIAFTNGQWFIVATNKEGGDVMGRALDVKSVVSANGTYNFRSEQTNRADAIVALGASMELYDVETGLLVYLKTP